MNRIKPINVTHNFGRTIVVFSGHKIEVFEDENEVLLDILIKLKEGKTDENIIKEMKIKDDNFLESDYYFIFENIIKAEGILQDIRVEHSLTKYEEEKFSRQLNLYQRLPNVGINDAIKIQNKLKGSHIILLGVGGVGSHLATSLVSMGIGEITLVDFDSIELSNTTRQALYTEKDIGRLKVEVAKEKLSLYNPMCKINLINCNVSNNEDFDKIIKNKDNITFVINTLDTPRGKIRVRLDDYMYETGIPYIYNSSIGFSVSVGPMILKEKTKKYRNSLEIDKENKKVEYFNSLGDFSNVYEPLNALAAQYTVNEVFKYIVDPEKVSLYGKELLINMNNLEFNIINLEDENE